MSNDKYITMKQRTRKLEQAYVIIKSFDSIYNYFQDYISFDKLALEKKCQKLNRAFHKKSKDDSINLYQVMDLKSALDKFRDNIADEYTEHDASY